MKRNSIVALTVAGVLGATGGTALALGHLAVEQIPSPPGSAVPRAAEGQTSTLLYATSTYISDGNARITLEPGSQGMRGKPASLARLGKGYVVSTYTTSGTLTYPVYHVAADGAMRELGTSERQPTVSAKGDLLAFRDRNRGTVEVYDDRGRRTASRRLADPDPALAWLTSQLLITSAADKDGRVPFLRWDPHSGTTYGTLSDEHRDQAVGMANLTVSPDSSHLAGKTAPDGSSGSDFDQCTNLRSTEASNDGRDDWQSCDWVNYGHGPFRFSPDGSQLLLVGSQTDGFGPTAFVVVDVVTGPGSGLTRIELPPASTDGSWADEESVWVTGAAEGDLEFTQGSFIARCTIGKACRTVARIPEAVVLAS